MRRDARRLLGVGVALAMMAAGGARAEVRPIHLGGCSGGCESNVMADAAAAQDVKVTLSLSGGGQNGGAEDPISGALVFDPEAVPTVLASGLPSALTPEAAQASGLRGGSPDVDFEYVLKHPDQIGGPEDIARALFLSVPSLVGELTFGGFLADGNAYFATQNAVFFSGRLPIGSREVIASHGASRVARFSTGDSDEAPAKAAHSPLSSIASSFESSQ